MSKILFLGWEFEEDKHDKIWGVIKLDDNNLISFWGRRPTVDRTPNSIQLKRWEDNTNYSSYRGIKDFWNDSSIKGKFKDLEILVLKKRKRYKPIAEKDYENICPGLVTYMEQMLLMTRLSI